MAENEFNLPSLVQNVKYGISQHFDKLIAGLISRKEEMLKALDDLDKYYRDTLQTYYEQFEKIDSVLSNAELTYKHNSSIDVKAIKAHKYLSQQQKQEIKEKIVELEKPIDIIFKCTRKVNEYILDSGCLTVNGGRSLISALGKLDIAPHLLEISVDKEETDEFVEVPGIIDRRKDPIPILDSLSYNVIDYTTSLPCDIMSSNRTERFIPSGIAIDPDTSLIYATNYGVVPKIVVFTSEGVFSKDISPKFPRSLSRIRLYGITIARGRIYVSDATNGVIFAVSLQSGETLYQSVRINSLNNIDVDRRDGEVFACDKRGMKIQTFNEFLVLKKHFGDRLLQGPTDVKVRDDKVIVLDNGDFALRFFTKKGLLLGENITFQSRHDTLFIGRLFYSSGKRVDFFDIDAEGNAYISYYESPIIRKFDVFGGQVLQFGKEKSGTPEEGFQTKGIAVDKQGRVVCISNKFPGPIQFFSAKTLEPCSI